MDNHKKMLYILLIIYINAVSIYAQENEDDGLPNDYIIEISMYSMSFNGMVSFSKEELEDKINSDNPYPFDYIKTCSIYYLKRLNQKLSQNNNATIDVRDTSISFSNKGIIYLKRKNSIIDTLYFGLYGVRNEIGRISFRSFYFFKGKYYKTDEDFIKVIAELIPYDQKVYLY